MNASAPAVLESLGAQSTAAGDYDTALHYYEKYMEINDKNPQIIFNMAMIYKTKGDEETADQLFGQVIMNFADSPLAESAQGRAGILAETGACLMKKTLQKKSCRVFFYVIGKETYYGTIIYL